MLGDLVQPRHKHCRIHTRYYELIHLCLLLNNTILACLEICALDRTTRSLLIMKRVAKPIPTDNGAPKTKQQKKELLKKDKSGSLDRKKSKESLIPHNNQLVVEYTFSEKDAAPLPSFKYVFLLTAQFRLVDKKAQLFENVTLFILI